MKQRKINHVGVPLAVATAALVSAGTVNASGFALVEQSVKQVGSAISGGAAAAEDASTIFFNPAGMTRLKGSQMAVGGHVIMPSSKFSGSATATHPLLAGISISGGEGGEAASTAFLPSFYFSYEVSEQLWAGVGIGAPFGLSTEYDSDWTGRYHATRSEVSTININPSLAYKVNDQLSLGAGLNFMRASAELSNAVDYSLACLGSALASLGVCTSSGLTTPASVATDGEVTVEGDDWGYGFNLGVLYEVTPKTRIGAAYRSQVKQELEGTADFDGPSGISVPALLAAAMPDGDASAAVDLPASLSMSVTTNVAPKWDLMADVTWTQWSNFEELRIKFANSTDDSVQPEEWEDTYKISLGFNYHHNAQWTWRGGIAYDQTPIPSAELRTPRIPGNDRKWIAAGVSYVASPRMSLDFALAHLFVSDTSIDATDITYGHNLAGTYESDVNILSAQLNWQF
jgi:long-chain fatty acid transport protein